ncbi:MAG TPA: YncE family protein [Acidimicrobiia bacterium]|nr:YncE family protein [Acidimicrobiia bacterium]
MSDVRSARSSLAARLRHRPSSWAALTAATVVSVTLASCGGGSGSTNTQRSTPTTAHTAAIQTVPGMPPVVDSANLYSEAGVNHLSAGTAGALPRVYVPNLRSNTVSVIDPATLKIVDTFPVGANPQHVVPSYDLQTLWVTNNAEGQASGTLTPIDPKTGHPGAAVPVADPYNMYFTPDGKSAIVVAEALKRLDFRDPHAMALQYSIPTPDCAGVNHADFSIDGRYMIASCEFQGSLVKVDLVARKVVGYLPIVASGMPQDVRVSPDGKTFYVAEMTTGRVYLVDGDAFAVKGSIPTAVGSHGLYFSRDATKLYVSNRGFPDIQNVHPKGPGSVSVIDVASGKITATWPVPGGGSPDMGNVTADGKQLWLSGRYDSSVYVFDTATGAVTTIPVGTQPHGLCVWPQPGRYSVGHTGILR